MKVRNDDKGEGLQLFNVLESMQPIVQKLAVGSNDSMATQLITKSKQQHILKFTPNDAVKRFKNLNSYKLWYANGHTIHWLLGQDFDLAGVIWYRVKTFPHTQCSNGLNPQETFAIRLYEGYVGHHLALPFMKLSLRTFINLKKMNNQKINDMWLSTTPENLAAISSYLKLGYGEVYRDEHNVIMTISANDLVSTVKTID